MSKIRNYRVTIVPGDCVRMQGRFYEVRRIYMTLSRGKYVTEMVLRTLDKRASQSVISVDDFNAGGGERVGAEVQPDASYDRVIA